MSITKKKSESMITDNKCIVCREKLVVGAQKCINCNSYQAAWKNQLSYYQGFVGLITAIFAAVIYSAPIINKVFFWEDKAAVYEYVGDSHVVVSNFGDGPIFVKGLTTHFKSQNGAYVDDHVLLNSTIEKGAVKTITLINKTERQIVESTYSHTSVFNSLSEYNLANNFSGTLQEIKDVKKCYLRTIVHTESNFIKLFKSSYGNKFYTSDGTGILDFYSLKTGKLNSASFKVESFLQSDNKQCYIKK